MKSENEVEAEGIAFMREQGWLAIRQNVGFLWTGNEHDPRRIRVGKPGQCDWMFVRPMMHTLGPGTCEVEFKAEGVVLKPTRKDDKRQLEYIAKRNYQGVPATWVNSLEALKVWFYGKQLDKAWRLAA